MCLITNVVPDHSIRKKELEQRDEIYINSLGKNSDASIYG